MSDCVIPEWIIHLESYGLLLATAYRRLFGWPKRTGFNTIQISSNSKAHHPLASIMNGWELVSGKQCGHWTACI